MENQNPVFFEPDTGNPNAGKLIISKACTLDDVYQHPLTPPILKSTLEKMVTWHARNETTVDNAIRSHHRFPQFQAYLLATGSNTEGEALQIPIGYQNVSVQYADVRATPADEPIVSAFVCLQKSAQKITGLRIVITGAHIESPYLLDTSNQLIVNNANTAAIDKLMELVETELQPESDYLGSAEYRLAMAKVTVKRAFHHCLEDK